MLIGGQDIGKSVNLTQSKEEKESKALREVDASMGGEKNREAGGAPTKLHEEKRRRYSGITQWEGRNHGSHPPHWDVSLGSGLVVDGLRKILDTLGALKTGLGGE